MLNSDDYTREDILAMLEDDVSHDSNQAKMRRLIWSLCCYNYLYNEKKVDIDAIRKLMEDHFSRAFTHIQDKIGEKKSDDANDYLARLIMAADDL